MAKKNKNLILKHPKPETNDPTYKDYGDLLENRNVELCNDKDIRDTLSDLYYEIVDGFDGQGDRADSSMDYWDLYNCKLGPKQFYMGNTQVYVPIIHDAVNARVTRFTNQVFPSNKRYVEVLSNDNSVPNGLMALMESYVAKCKLRTEIVPALLRAGDIEGQYSIYVSWEKIKRTVAHKVKAPVALDNGLPDTEEEVDDIRQVTIVDSYPKVEVISDADICVLPNTVDSVDEALCNGGSVTIIRRWSKSRLSQMIKDGHIDKKAGGAVIKQFEGGDRQDADKRKDMGKELSDAAGIKKSARGKFILVYETWVYLTRKTAEEDEKGKKVERETRRLYRVFFAGQDLILSVRRNPLWCDRLPLLSVPAEKLHGSFKGISKVAAAEDFQIIANDAAAEGMDSAAYSMLPIVMTDPERNPRVGSLILALAAVWQTDPKSTQIVQFPELWTQAFEIVNACRAQVFQTLSVNPAAITQGYQKQKPSQAQVAQEQAVDILTTADAVTVIEEGILTPMLTLFLELDHQYRDKNISVRAYGPMGQRANVEEVEPVQMNNRYAIRWYGVEQARNQAAMQNQISALNVLRGIPPQMYQPYKVNMAPVLKQLVENVFGPRLAPELFEDMREQLGMPPKQENEMLHSGIPLMPNALDNHQQHLQEHMKALQTMGDPHGAIQAHMAAHMTIMQQMAQAAQQPQPGLPGAPGGAGKGVPGSPKGGAQVSGPKGAQQPAGAMHADRMPGADPGAAPRG